MVALKGYLAFIKSIVLNLPIMFYAIMLLSINSYQLKFLPVSN